MLDECIVLGYKCQMSESIMVPKNDKLLCKRIFSSLEQILGTTTKATRYIYILLKILRKKDFNNL